MARSYSAKLLFTIVASALLAGSVSARNRLPHDGNSTVSIAEAAPTLAPFQHVRFCLRYPSDCKSEATENERVDLTPELSDLLDRINRSVNSAIAPTVKQYGPELRDGWTIAPAMGDCNDYAVTKRHELLQSGLPAKALRLSVVTTVSGIGHLVLVVSTSKGDVVLDNLTGTIRSWDQTDYRWLKIQSAADARFWYEVKANGLSASRAERKIRLADR